MDTIHWLITDEDGRIILRMEKMTDELRLKIYANDWQAYELVDNKKLVNSCDMLRILDEGHKLMGVFRG